MTAQKLCNNIFTKRETDTAIILTPTDNVLVGVRPQEIAEKARVRYVSGSHNALNLFHIL